MVAFRKFQRARVAAVSVAVLALALVAGCGGGDSGGDDGSGGAIKVGASLPLTSPLSAEAESLQSGYEMAAEDINADGGVDGQDIEIDIADDKADPALAKQLTQKQITQDGVAAVLGSFGSATSLTQSTEAARSNIPGVYPFASEETMVERGLDTVFNLYPLSQQAEASTDEFLVNQVKPKKVAIVYVDNPFAIGGAESSKETLEGEGIEVPVFEKIGLESQFIGPVAKAKQAGVDVIKAIGYNTNYTSYVQALEQTDLDVDVATFETQIPFEKRSIDTVGKKAAELIVGNPYWLLGQTPDFDKAYKEKYGKAPEFQAVLGYSAVQVLAEALKEAGSTEPDAIREALAATDMETVVGRITFDERGQYNQQPTVGQLVDGEVVTIWPEDKADGELAPWVPISQR